MHMYTYKMIRKEPLIYTSIFYEQITTYRTKRICILTGCNVYKAFMVVL